MSRIPLICAFISMFFNCFVYLIVRRLQDVHFTIINANYGILLTLVSITWWWAEGHPINYEFTFTQLLLILGIGLATTISSQCKIIACQLEKAGRVTSIGFVEIIFAALADLMIFDAEFSNL